MAEAMVFSTISRRYEHIPRAHVSSACIACRKKRKKCDARQPCGRCIASDETCVYRQDDARKQKPSSSISATIGTSNLILSGVSETYRKEQENEALEQNGIPTTREVSMASVGRSNPEQAVTVHEPSSDAATETSGQHVSMNQSCRKARSETISLALCGCSGTLSVHSCRDRVSSPDANSPSRSQSHLSAAVLESRPVYPKILPKPRPVVAPVKKGSPAGRPFQPKNLPTWRLQRRPYAVTGYTRTFGNLAPSSAVKTTGYPQDIQLRQNLIFLQPEYMIMPLLDNRDTHLGRVYTDFQNFGRTMILQGVAPSRVVSPGPLDATLLFRDRRPEDPIGATSWACEMVRSWTGLFNEVVQLGSVVLMATLMGWLIQPTAENYARIPEFQRPTRLARLKPHPPELDLLGVGPLRDILINSYREYITPLSKAKLNLEWHRSIEDALDRDVENQRVYISAEFVAFASDSRNWSLRRSILDEWPTLSENMTILDDD